MNLSAESTSALLIIFVLTLITIILPLSVNAFSVIDQQGDVDVLYINSEDYQPLENSLDNVLYLRTNDGKAILDLGAIELTLNENSIFELSQLLLVKGSAYVKVKGFSKLQTDYAVISSTDAEYELIVDDSTKINMHKGSASVRELETGSSLNLNQFYTTTISENQAPTTPIQFRSNERSYTWIGYLILLVIIVIYGIYRFNRYNKLI